MHATQQGPLAWKRVYVDIPTETHARLGVLAKERGMSQKALVAELIEQACSSAASGKSQRKSKR